MEPLPGAIFFLEWLQERFQVIILSDTFYEFSEPFMRKLGWPTLFCHSLITDSEGTVVDYKLRQPDPKRESVKALHSLKYRVIAAGDSYNDTTMLKEADVGILFHAPENVILEFPQFESVQDFDSLRKSFVAGSNRSIRL
jgi:phosphoserine/homoserine phosphotransferase